MADYKTKDIRNIALLGHGSEGKTTLTEAMLFAAGMIDRQGKVESGNTVTDFDPEENKRTISISAATAPVEWKGTKINVIDVPGYFDFIGEMMGPLRVVETAAIVVGAVSGLTVGAEKAWAYAKKNNVARMFIVNRMDAENANYERTIEQLREKFGSSVVPVLLPMGDGANFKGVVNVLENKAYSGKGKDLKEVPVPADMKDAIESATAEITEAAAEAVDELLEKYFEEGELSHEEILQGFSAGMKSGTIVPVVPVSAVSGIGVAKLLDIMSAYLHSPEEAEYTGVNPKTGDAVTRKGAGDPFSAFVFKTIADPFVGKLSLLKVCSGTLTNGTALYNANAEKAEKAGGLFLMRGKNQVNVGQVNTGDIAALSKLQFTNTGDTLCDAGNPVRYEQIQFPEPSVQKAVYAAKQGEEDKVFSGLARLQEEDPSIRIEKNAETTETILWGQGELHLDVIRNKLQSKFGANAVLQDPRIPYRETIRKTVSCQGRHKKQSGGHGQFGDVWIRFEPQSETDDLVFAEEVFGGSVPKNFFPAVEKGLREACLHGPLAGYPVVNLKTVLYDGSYHPVDSSEIAFKTAANLAYKAAMPEASPVLLEPVCELKVTVPDQYMGDILGDLNKRRGRVMGMNPTGDGETVLEAEVPMAEMTSYAIDLRSMTQSRGSFVMHFVRYEQCPADAQEKAIAAAKAMQDAE